MKYLNLTLVLLLSFTFVNLSAQKYEASLKWATPELLTTSESILYNPADQFLYVSCINGNPVDKDNNGFISQLSLSGEITLLNWANGLSAPKGMVISNNQLYVTDIDRVVAFDLKTGEQLNVFPVKGAKFLNDLAAGPDNEIYITDLSTNIIHKLQDGVVTEWFKDEVIINPNGMDINGSRLFVGTKNGIFEIDTQSGKFWHVIKNTGSIDGLKIVDDESFIISDWNGKIQLVNYDQDYHTIFNTTNDGMNAADFEYIAELKLIIIPTFLDNRVVAYDLIKIGK